MNTNNTYSSICWLRHDLRLSDNPALLNAIEQGDTLIVYIYDNINSDESTMMGQASKWWLHHSLTSLDLSLNNRLSIFMGDPHTILAKLSKTHKVKNIYWNRCYEPWIIKRDKNIKKSLQENGVNVETTNASLLWEPWEIHKEDQTPYLVFTPFFKRGCLNALPPRVPLKAPNLNNAKKSDLSLTINELNLLPKLIVCH